MKQTHIEDKMAEINYKQAFYILIIIIMLFAIVFFSIRTYNYKINQSYTFGYKNATNITISNFVFTIYQLTMQDPNKIARFNITFNNGNITQTAEINAVINNIK